MSNVAEDFSRFGQLYLAEPRQLARGDSHLARLYELTNTAYLGCHSAVLDKEARLDEESVDILVRGCLASFECGVAPISPDMR